MKWQCVTCNDPPWALIAMPVKCPESLTNQQRQAKFRASQRANGLASMTIWVSASEREAIQSFLKKCGTSRAGPTNPLLLPSAQLVEAACARLADLLQSRSEVELAYRFRQISLDYRFPRSIREDAAVLDSWLSSEIEWEEEEDEDEEEDSIDVSDAERLKALEAENAELRRLLAEAMRNTCCRSLKIDQKKRGSAR